MSHKVIIIVAGVAGVLAAGYVVARMMTPPTLVVNAYSLLDGSGTFEFGKVSAAIPAGSSGMGSTTDGGWGWTGSFTAYSPTTGWTFQWSKNGQVKKTAQINGVGTF